ncbi:MAG: hypothetical protein ACE5PT_01870 [Gemmatimonadales bacterium]
MHERTSACVDRTVVALAFLFYLSACGSGAEPVGEEPGIELERELREAAREDSISVPSYPEARAGRLVMVSDGSLAVEGSWKPTAGLCDEPRSLQLIAQSENFGVIIVVELPDTGAVAGNYAMVSVEEDSVPGINARLGIQVLADGGAFAYQVTEGELVIERLDDRVTGRLAGMALEVALGAKVGLAGVFDDIPVTLLPDDQCRSTLTGN